MGALRTSIAGAVVGTVAAAGLYTGVVGPAVGRTAATSADATPLAASVPHAPTVVVTVKAHRAQPAPQATTQDLVEGNESAQAPAPPAAPAPAVAPVRHLAVPRSTPPARRTAVRARSASSSGSSGSSSGDSGSSAGSGSGQEHETETEADGPETSDD